MRVRRIPLVDTALLVSPPNAGGGNRVTGLRWARLLRELGWHVLRDPERADDTVKVVIALHARRSRAGVEAARRRAPDAPLVVAATGTDLYRDLPAGDAEARAGLDQADRIVVLQERAVGALPEDLRSRARVVHQSVSPFEPRPERDPSRFEAVMLAGVRPVKDPETAVCAVARLPADSELVLDHLGPVLDPELAARLPRAEQGGRYRWHGERPRREALCRLARARVLVSPSREEGGANVLTEAFALGTPVLASRVDGSLGLLGEDHPGLFQPGDAEGLTRLLVRCEREPAFLEELARRSRARAWMADPDREREAWRALLDELEVAP